MLSGMTCWSALPETNLRRREEQDTNALMPTVEPVQSVHVCSLLQNEDRTLIVVRSRASSGEGSRYALLSSVDSQLSKSKPSKRFARSESVSPDAAEGIAWTKGSHALLYQCFQADNSPSEAA